MRKSPNAILIPWWCNVYKIFIVVLILLQGPAVLSAQQEKRPRARDLGIVVGVLPPGPLDAITDVAGVEVGQTTIIQGANIRTGVTAILPHAGNMFREKVPGAVFVGNAFGKLIGSTQVEELGDIETPILLTSTLSTGRVADDLVTYMLSLPGNQDVKSINPVVGETNDGHLNDIQARAITPEDVFNAIRNAKGGPVEEGDVGAGTGTMAFGFKGGIGTASRRLPASLGGYTVGVLVQSNFGGILCILGAPVGRELGQYYLKDKLEPGTQSSLGMRDTADGSIMMVVATNAPLGARNLRRLAARTMMGLARTGAAGSNGSGDYAIAFSTAREVRIRPTTGLTRQITVLTNEAMSPLFLATIEATEEAIYNSLFKATTMTGNGVTVKALPIPATLRILRKYGVIPKTAALR